MLFSCWRGAGCSVVGGEQAVQLLEGSRLFSCWRGAGCSVTGGELAVQLLDGEHAVQLLEGSWLFSCLRGTDVTFLLGILNENEKVKMQRVTYKV